MSQFKIISRPLGTVQCYVLQRDDGAEFEVLSGFGAGLNAWRVPIASANSSSPNVPCGNGDTTRDSKGNLRDLLFGYRDGSTLHQIAPDTNAGCRLSPFPGRTAYAKFTWKGETYQLVNNVSWAPHALHGFLTNKEWKFESFESDSEKCVAVFSCDWPGAFAGFPFPFRAVNKVTFTGESATIEACVTNVGNKELPYSEGWHPYFMLGEKIDGLTMSLPASNLALLDSADLPTGNFKADTRFVGGRKIGDEFINDCFCLGTEIANSTATAKQPANAPVSNGNTAHVVLSSADHSLDIWQCTGSEQYNAIQIYTPPDRMSIAIEPMTSEPDALNHHRGLIVIPPGESRTFTFGAIYK